MPKKYSGQVRTLNDAFLMKLIVCLIGRGFEFGYTARGKRVEIALNRQLKKTELEIAQEARLNKLAREELILNNPAVRALGMAPMKDRNLMEERSHLQKLLAVQKFREQKLQKAIVDMQNAQKQ